MQICIDRSINFLSDGLHLFDRHDILQRKFKQNYYGKKRMELYSVFDDVRKPDYPFTPHITLAYYNINGFHPQTARTLEDTVKRLNHQEEFELELNTDHLYYQKFRSMNDYINIFSFKKQCW